MSIPSKLILSLLGLSSLSAFASPSSPQEELFAAMIMTKSQKASAVPTDSGVLLHDSESGDWKRLGPAIQMISSAIADPSDPQTIFFACGNGIARSTDGGESWRLVTGWRESDVLQIAIDPENGDNIYAATAWGPIVSRDGGDSWSAAKKGLSEYFSKGIVLDQRNNSRLLLATTTGLFQSTNKAKSWKRNKAFPEVAVLRLRRGESNPDIWLAGTEGKGVWISANDGKTWRKTAPGLQKANIYAVAVDPTNADNLAAGGWDTGVHFSTDQGKTWQAASGTLPSHNITTLLFDPHHPQLLWASTFEEGTFYSDDFGSSWHSANLDGAYVFDLGYLPSNSKSGDRI